MYTLSNVRLREARTQGRPARHPAPKKAISPVIATIILIAITIVIAIAVAGWVFGLFGSYSRTQAVTIVASASTCTAPSTCTLVLSNQGGSSVTVVSASINGQTAGVSSPATAVIPAGATGYTVVITASSMPLVAGQTVQVQLGLSNGNTLSTTLVVS